MRHDDPYRYETPKSISIRRLSQVGNSVFGVRRSLVLSHSSVTYELPRGTFKVEIPVGHVSICIENREFEPKPPTMPATPPGMNLPPEVIKSMQASSKESSKVSDRWVKLPEKYYDMGTSGLKILVKGGKQQETIEFKK